MIVVFRPEALKRVKRQSGKDLVGLPQRLIMTLPFAPGELGLPKELAVLPVTGEGLIDPPC